MTGSTLPVAPYMKSCLASHRLVQAPTPIQHLLKFATFVAHYECEWRSSKWIVGVEFGYGSSEAARYKRETDQAGR